MLESVGWFRDGKRRRAEEIWVLHSLNVVEFSTLVGARVGQTGVAATKIVAHVMRLVTSRRAKDWAPQKHRREKLLRNQGNYAKPFLSWVARPVLLERVLLEAFRPLKVPIKMAFANHEASFEPFVAHETGADSSAMCNYLKNTTQRR